jgi:hypothetical protein
MLNEVPKKQGPLVFNIMRKIALALLKENEMTTIDLALK